MADEIVTIRADQLDEITGEPEGGMIVALHDGSGILPSKKISWTNLRAWILKSGSIIESMIALGAVTAAKIANGAIIASKIGAGQVWTNHILDGNITEAKIGSGAVTNAKVASGAVGTLQLADGAVTSNKIGDKAVTSNKIGDNAVTDDKISPSAVSTDHIENNSVTEAKLASAVLSGVGRFNRLEASSAIGNVSYSSPPNYSVDDEYTHIFDFAAGLDPVVLIEQRTQPLVEIADIALSGVSAGIDRITVVVAGEAGRVADYRLIVVLV
jgi:hypothetical protein